MMLHSDLDITKQLMPYWVLISEIFLYLNKETQKKVGKKAVGKGATLKLW